MTRYEFERHRQMPLQPPPVSPVVKRILVITIAVFVLQALFSRGRYVGSVGVIEHYFGLSLDGILHVRVWQLVTYAFLHGDILHILLNMLMVYFFGREIEMLFGERRFLTFYLLCAVVAGVGWLLLSGEATAYCIGASGAAFGIAGAFAAIYPKREIVFLLFFIIPMRMTARNLALLLAGVTLIGLIYDDGNIAHAAHLAGGLAGYIYARRWAGRSASGDAVPLRRQSITPEAFPSPSAWFDRAGDTPEPTDEAPAPEEIDRILDKIHAEGVQSLTRRERRILQEASRAG